MKRRDSFLFDIVLPVLIAVVVFYSVYCFVARYGRVLNNPNQPARVGNRF